MKYRARVGLTYPATKKDLELKRQGKPHKVKRTEAGETASDIPAQSVPWLLESGAIEEVKDRG